MYETFYGLKRRPFSATPDPGCYVPVPALEASLAEIRSTVVAGQGIAVLTAPPGLGKTLACLRLISVLGDSFACVWLPTANYGTRRSLLQAILYELGRPYAQMAEQELRLQLISAARTQATRERAVVIVADEAHLLSPRLLEELRGLTNVAAAGKGLIRVVLCGQLSLEETLAGPELAALNQRIDCQATLVPLSTQESRDYLTSRVSWAGGNLADVLASDAVEMICRVSDGNPRCLNQLADHALMLGAQRGERPVAVATIRVALDELKQLPLMWVDSGAELETRSADEATGPTSPPDVVEVGSVSKQPAGGTAATSVAAVIEVGGDSDGPSWKPAGRSTLPAREPASRQPAAPTLAAPRRAADAGVSSIRLRGGPPTISGFVEEPVVDRYAMLDAGLVPPARVTVSGSLRDQCRPVGSSHVDLVFDRSEPAESDQRASAKREPGPLVATPRCERSVEQILDELPAVLDTALGSSISYDSQPQIIRSAGRRLGEFATVAATETDIGCLLLDTCSEIARVVASAAAAEPRPANREVPPARGSTAAAGSPSRDEFDVVQPEDGPCASDGDAPSVPMPPRERIEREDGPGALRPPRHYAQLFSELRRRHRQRS